MNWNATAQKWVIDPNCITSLATEGRYNNYCGLNSYYNGYEIYDSTFNIMIK